MFYIIIGINIGCKIKTDDTLQLVESTEIMCFILDTDDEWIIIRFIDKKKNQITKLLRIVNINEIEIIEKDTAI